MPLNIRIKKWERDNNYFAQISFSDVNDEIIKVHHLESKSKNEFNEKISILLKNFLVLKN